MTGNQAFACIPLTAEGRSFGGMSFSFANAMQFGEEDRGFMLTLGQQCAQAIARARLYEAEQRARAVSEAARSAAEAANRIKDEFLAVLSHELRSPLNPILGWTKLLRSRKFDEKATDRALETIERNAKLQTQLIEDLLDVSRILRGKLVLNVCPVNLVTTIEAALETVRLAAQAKEIQIQTLLAPNVGLVSGDSNRLQQVVWNLLSNAVKFTPAGGRVEVRLEKVGEGLKVSRLQVEGSTTNVQPSTQYAQIQVSDTGKGITPEFLPHVFEYFRQENSTTTRQFGGLGLGLAIVRYLTELHGGSVLAESPGEGLGATFTVRLPLRVADGVATQDEAQPDGSANLSGLRVLVVDDEADIRELVAFILEQSGAEVTVTTSAEEALIALNQSVPDVLLSDIGMPEVDGYMLMRQVRALSPERGGRLPAIAFTAYAGEYNQQQALAAGFQLHISKPVEPEKLVSAIASLVVHPIDFER
jgi:signal transduction histidine kinase/ActR/RegA family two-component response regulator